MRSKTRVFIAAAVVAVFAATSAVALATSPHFKKGGTPTCTIGGTGTTTVTAECTGSLTGLGFGDLHINTTLTGFATYQCQNPSGQNEPAGQNKVLTGPTTTPNTVPASAVKNGNATFDTNNPVPSLTAAPTVSGSAAGCNNDKWTGVNPSLTLTDITLTIDQGGPTLFTCTASNPAGLTGTVALDGSSC